MVKWFFIGTPFECQIFTQDKSQWWFPEKYYFDIETYMWSIGLGKYCFCWGLPKEGKDYIRTPCGDYVFPGNDNWKDAKTLWKLGVR